MLATPPAHGSFWQAASLTSLSRLRSPAAGRQSKEVRTLAREGPGERPLGRVNRRGREGGADCGEPSLASGCRGPGHPLLPLALGAAEQVTRLRPCLPAAALIWILSSRDAVIRADVEPGVKPTG